MPLARHIAAFQEQAAVLGTMDVGRMWDRLLGEFLDEWARLNRQGLSVQQMEREMAAFLEALSTKPLDKIARVSSTLAYNQGRTAELLTAREQGDIEFAVRSEVLDSKSCGPCFEWDGFVAEVGSDEYNAHMPPAHCLGWDQCRGFPIGVAAEAA